MSIVIPCGYEPTELSVTLDSLRACIQPTDFDYEIIVGNDGADPAVSSVAAEYGVAEVLLPVNQGPAAARNRAIEASAGEVIAMLDCDLVLCPGWINEAWKAGHAFDYAGGLTVTNRRLIRTLGQRYDAIAAFDLEANLGKAHWAQTVNLIVRRSLLERIGKFDERLRCGEDAELGDRAFRCGATQGFWREAKAEHPPRTFRQQWSKHRGVMVSRRMIFEIWPDRFPERGRDAARILRLLAPPRRIGRRDARTTEFGIAYVPIFYLMTWAVKLHCLYHLLVLRVGGIKEPDWGGYGNPAKDRARPIS